MATNIPQNLYKGDAVVFNSEPYVNFAIKQLQQKQAKSEALDKYFGEELAKVTDAGMRQQERPALIEAKKKYQDYWMANKDKIKNPSKDGGKAWGELQQIKTTMLDVVASSKVANEVTKQGASLFYDPTKRDLIEESSLEEFDLHTKPIYDVKDGQIIKNEFDPVANPKGHKTYDLSKTAYKPKYDLKKYFTDFGKNIEPELTKEIHPIEGKPLSQKEISIFRFSDDQGKGLFEIANQDYESIPDLRKKFEREVPLATWFELDANGNPTTVKKDHAEQFIELNNLHKKYQGNDINTQKELFAAMAVRGKLLEETQKAAVKTNLEAKNAQDHREALQLKAIEFQNSLKKLGMEQRLKQGKEKQEDFNDADAVLRNAYDIINQGEKMQSASAALANSVLSKFGIKTNVGTDVIISDPNLLKEFANIKKVGTTAVPPDNVIFNKKTGQYSLIYDEYYTEKDGERKLASPKQVVPMSSRDYIRLKVKEMNPNKTIGQLNSLVDEIIDKGGGLYNALQTMYGGKASVRQSATSNTTAPKSTTGTPKAKTVTGKSGKKIVIPQ